MKHILHILILLSPFNGIIGQGLFSPDTLLSQNFEIDPTHEMIEFPNGDDIFWVNWDEDRKKTNCGTSSSPADSLSPWYWDYDLGADVISNNNAFTSCSFSSKAFRSRNWLITPPVYIEDSSYVLSWKSSAFQGPFLTDGYHVLISAQGNFPEDFADTLFSASETTTPFSVSNSMGFPLDVSKYNYSPGYLHANGYTNTQYYSFVDTDFPNGFYLGKLEPHIVSLKAYTGKTVYVTFLHDSFDDFLLQIDDILIARAKLSGVLQTVLRNDWGLTVWPSLVQDRARVQWEGMDDENNLTLQIFDLEGRIHQSYTLQQGNSRHFELDMTHARPGHYVVVLKNANGISKTRFSKI
ncbi:MAG: T9SS type A sorting domain-containing protein [Bacteroidetes bacterium]|nr:T9SS type A sorting domain-containing protein [Bacteroidota bacterium]